MVGAMFCISVNDVLIKALSGHYPLHQLVAMRSTVGIVLTFGLLMAEGGLRLLRTGRPGLHILRGLLIVIANYAFFAAIVAMPLAQAYAIYFVAPLFVTLMSIPILGEQVGRHRFTAVGVGFGGVLLILVPELTASDGGLGWVAILPVIAAAGYATMSVLTRKLGATSRASVLAIQLHFAFLSVSLLMFLVAGDGRFIDETSSPSVTFLLRAWIWPQPQDTLPILGLGLLSGIVGYLITQAYRISNASAVAPFEYVAMVFGLFWGWAIFGEWPAPIVFVGAAVVVSAGIYVVWRERRQT